MSDPAHILFPSDAPKSQKAPEWFKAEQSAATACLAGVHDNGVAAAKVPEPGKAGSPASPAGSADVTKPEAVLFKDGAADLGAKAVTEILDGFANASIGDGDGGVRARAIEAARDGLLADAKAHGMDTEELSEAVAILKERQSDSITEPTPEVAEQRMAEALEACRAENISDADLSLARRLIADIEKVAPGTVATLERTGSGNDIRLIRKAVAEAKRRAYR
ncbi:hypothetical protein [Bradyrhizobium cenepequi]|uniref:hypothetical protein n=1 Tax=Bradyrhizobium cenepequi TaxID=2821403 RepID=UPI001CE35CD2|nr:hypothetical protein [Bradyrhizobium cenepequi]MCA6110472.1 hypothetical protein [Bradyrhizobium cenepequi]